MGWSNPQQFMVPPTAMGAPPPELLEKQAKTQADMLKANASMMDAQSKHQASQAKAQSDLMRAQTDMVKAENELAMAQRELQSKAADRASRERIQLIDLAQNLAVHPYSAEVVNPLIAPAMQDIGREEEAMQTGLMPPNIGGQ